jgi:hypothetical protein
MAEAALGFAIDLAAVSIWRRRGASSINVLIRLVSPDRRLWSRTEAAPTDAKYCALASW